MNTIIKALQAARDCIQQDRTSFADCSMGPDNTMAPDDAAAVAEYDAVLALVDEALGQQATPEPIFADPRRDDFVRVARVFARAYGRHEDAPKYLPRTVEEARAFEPHGWVIAAMMQAFADGKFHATPEPVGEPVHVEVVGEIVATEDGNDVRWSVEGGADAIPEGMVLLIADRQITDDTGSGEVYTRPAPAPQQVPMTDEAHGADYCRGFRDGYEQRHAEVLGALT